MPNPVILAVEDNSNHAALLHAVFAIGMPDAEVRVVASAAEARAYLEGDWPYHDRARHPLPTVIVLDLWLPDATGLDILEWLADDGRFRDIPSLILSSSNDRRYADRAFALGARRFIFKPTGFDQLVATVQEVLHPWVREDDEEGSGVA